MRVGLLAVAALAAIAVEAAQLAPQGQQPVFRGGVLLVQLDVVVRDEAGRPVRGLTKTDFQILDEGRERPVAAATEFQHEAPIGSLVNQDVATSAFERLAVVVLDDKNRSGAGLDRAKDVARDVIRALAGRAHLALVRTSLEPGVEFTPNAQALLDALDLPSVLPPPPPSRPFPWNEMRGSLRLAGLWTSDVTPTQPARSPGRSGSAGPLMVPPNTDFNAIEDGVLSANDGRRKSFIIITEGAFYSRLSGPWIIGEVKKFDEGKLNSRQLLGDLHERLQAVLEAARRTNSTVSVIDPRADAGGGRPDTTGRPGLLRAALAALATSTGGTATARHDDLAGAVSRLTEDLDHYYVLGFEPPDPKSTKRRNVEVRVKRPGLVVRHRETYQLDQTATTRAGAAAKKDPLLGLAYSAIPIRDLPLRLWATALPPKPGAVGPVQVALWLDSGGARLTEYAVFTIDMNTNAEVGLPVGRTLTGVPPPVLRLDAPALPPGRYQLRVAARDNTAGGSVYQNITVPDFSRLPLAITGLIVATDPVIRAGAGTLAFAPTLDRAFPPDTTLHVAFELWRQGLDADVLAAIELRDASGTVVRQSERRISAVGDGRVATIMELAGLASGIYSLRARATGGAQTAIDEFAIVVTPGGGRD